jgi:hypothetical protein
LRHAPGQERRLDNAKLKGIIAAGRVFAVMSAAVRACIAANIELLLTDAAQMLISVSALAPLANDNRAALKLRKCQLVASKTRSRQLENASPSRSPNPSRDVHAGGHG